MWPPPAFEIGDTVRVRNHARAGRIMKVNGFVRKPRYLVSWEGGDSSFDIPEGQLYGLCMYLPESEEEGICAAGTKNLLLMWFPQERMRMFLCPQHCSDMLTGMQLPGTEKPSKYYLRTVRS